MLEKIVEVSIQSFRRAEEFSDRKDIALELIEKAGLRPLFMPELIDARIAAPKEDMIWQNAYTTGSLRAVGKTKKGTRVIVYAHIPNYFSRSENITRLIKKEKWTWLDGMGPCNSAYRLPKKEFWKLISLEDGNNVFVIDYENLIKYQFSLMLRKERKEKDYDTLIKPKFCEIFTEEEKEGLFHSETDPIHPELIPFFGQEERARKYLEKHRKFCGYDAYICWNKAISWRTWGRLLHVGDYQSSGGAALCSENIDGGGKFIGVDDNEVVL